MKEYDIDQMCYEAFGDLDDSESALFENVNTINPVYVLDAWELLAQPTLMEEVLNYHKTIQSVLISQTCKQVEAL